MAGRVGKGSSVAQVAAASLLAMHDPKRSPSFLRISPFAAARKPHCKWRVPRG